MTNEFDDLIKEFGSKGKQENTIPSTQFDDLIKEFSSGKYTIAPVTQSQQELGPPRPENFNGPTNTEFLNEPRWSRELNKGIRNLPTNILSSIVEDAKGGASAISKGIRDIAENRPAEGIGNVGMGLLGAVFSPVTGTSKEVIRNPITELTGSKDIGEKAEFLLTLGLPVARTGKAIQSAIPSNAAVEKLVEAIGIDNIPNALKRMKNNERLTFADVSPGARQDAQALVIQQGSHQTSLIDQINKRQSGARGQVERLYDDAMGAPVDVVKKIEELKKNAKDTGANIINPIVENSKPVDITSVVKYIDNAISSSGPVERATLKALKEGKSPSLNLSDAQSALFNVRENIRGDWKDNPQMFLDMKGEQGLHEVQKALRAKAQGLLDSDNPLQRELGGKLMKVRNQLVEAGGKEYKEALGKYADDMSVQEAFQSGQNVLRNRPTHIEDRPESLREYLKNAKPAEIEALREGARVAIDNQIRSARNAALKGEVIPEMEFNKQKLEMLFGKKEVEELARKLRDERDISKTTVDLLHGSQTASRQASNARVDLPEKKQSSILPYLAEGIGLLATQTPGIGVATAVAGSGIKHAIFKGKEGLAKKTNSEYANLLFSEGEQRQALMNILEQRTNNSNNLSISQKLNLSLPKSLINAVSKP